MIRVTSISVALLAAFGFALDAAAAPDAETPSPKAGKPVQCLYLSAGGKITVYQINAATGKLAKLQEVELPGAGPLGASPDRRFLYATASGGGKKNAAGIATFRVEPTGRLKLVHKASVNLRPGYLMTDAAGRFLTGNHYGAGKATVWRLDGGVYRGETVQEIELEQRAHSSVFAPNNNFLYVPATGPNKVFQLRFDSKTGRTEPNDPPFAPGPAAEDAARQPRHLIFHPSLHVAYTTNERELPGVGVWTWDPGTGRLKTVQNIVSQPKGFAGNITTADLHITPDGRYLYISNRDVTRRGARTGNDAIVGFEVNEKTGRLKLIGHYRCPHVPRSFGMDETGNYLYVAGQGDDTLGLFKINRNDGSLSQIGRLATGKRPSWVHCMSPPAK